MWRMVGPSGVLSGQRYWFGAGESIAEDKQGRGSEAVKDSSLAVF